MSKPHEIAEWTLDAGMSLALPIGTHHNRTEMFGHVTGRHPEVMDHTGPFDIAKADGLSGFDRAARGSLAAYSKTTGGFAALTRRPGRVFKGNGARPQPVLSRYGSRTRSGIDAPRCAMAAECPILAPALLSCCAVLASEPLLPVSLRIQTGQASSGNRCQLNRISKKRAPFHAFPHL